MQYILLHVVMQVIQQTGQTFPVLFDLIRRHSKLAIQGVVHDKVVKVGVLVRRLLLAPGTVDVGPDAAAFIDRGVGGIGGGGRLIRGAGALISHSLRAAAEWYQGGESASRTSCDARSGGGPCFHQSLCLGDSKRRSTMGAIKTQENQHRRTQHVQNWLNDRYRWTKGEFCREISDLV